MSRHNDEIDVAATVEEAERRRGLDDRGAASLGDAKTRARPGAKAFFALVVLLGICLGGFLIWQAFAAKQEVAEQEAAKEEQRQTVVNTMPELNQPDLDNPPPAPVPAEQNAAVIVPEPTTTAATAPSASTSSEPPPPSPAELLRQRRLSGELSGGASGGAGSTPAAQGQPASPYPPGYGYPPPPGMGGPAAPPPAPTFADRLSPVQLQATQASRISSRDLLMLKGTMIPCALITRIDSTLPGMVKCVQTRDVYSANGRTVLLDRGTEHTGFIEKGLIKGEARLFVAWSRAVTPKGVVIDLDSPGTDQLGAAGVGGKVHRHFAERFGAAILLSIIGDATDYLIARERAKGGDQISFGNTGDSIEDMSSIALRDSINIPPTLTKPHGAQVSIYVARDLDFGSIYDLRRKH